MMKYKGMYWNLISILIRKPMNKRYGKKFTSKTIKQANTIYRKMLNETDDIGADNPMASNIYMAYPFMAIWKAADGKIGIDDFGIITKEFMHRPIVKRFMGGYDVNKSEDMNKMKNKFHQMAKWLNDHPEYEEKSWDFNFDDTKHEDGTYYHFTRCPIEAYARSHGFLEILPVICDLDYLTSEARHAVLHREQTLATGGEMCDYWFVGDKIENPR